MSRRIDFFEYDVLRFVSLFEESIYALEYYPIFWFSDILYIFVIDLYPSPKMKNLFFKIYLESVIIMKWEFLYENIRSIFFWHKTKNSEESFHIYEYIDTAIFATILTWRYTNIFYVYFVYIK